MREAEGASLGAGKMSLRGKYATVGSRHLDHFTDQKMKAPGQGGKTGGHIRKRARVGRLAIHRRLVGVREAVGQDRCASGCEDGQSKKCRFHCVSPSQCPVSGIAFGLVLIRR